MSGAALRLDLLQRNVLVERFGWKKPVEFDSDPAVEMANDLG